MDYPTLSAGPKDLWTVAADWSVRFTLPDGRTGIVHVRKGFQTDGASVPRMAWFAAGHPMESPRVLAALAHDWLYAAQVTDRQTADEIYAAILRAVGRASWRVSVEYWALRLGGQSAWDGHAKAGDAKSARQLGALEWLDFIN